MSKNIDIVFFDAASGHRSSAVALKKIIQTNYPAYKVRTVNITEIFDHHRSFGKIVRSGINYFNWQIKNDIVFDLKGLINLSLLCHDLTFSKGIKKISEYWKASPPDAVVSVTPMYNPVLYRSAKLANPNVKCITIPVDFEEVKPRYWFTPKVEQYYLNATERLGEQAQKAGISKQFLYSLKGMIVDPDSYKKPDINIKEELKQLGLNEKLPTGFIHFGGQGSVKVLEIAKEMARQQMNVNAIFMCGKNESLYKKLSSLETPYPKAVFSYLKETPIHYLYLSDFAIGKPGAMTITEALITNTPLVAMKSTGMSPVQRGNEEWVTKSQTGIVAKNVNAMVEAVKQILEDKNFKENIHKNQHRAIEEAAEKIDYIINNN